MKAIMRWAVTSGVVGSHIDDSKEVVLSWREEVGGDHSQERGQKPSFSGVCGS